METENTGMQFERDMNTDVSINKKKKDEKVYDYDEALDLSGNGCYNLGLLATLSLSTMATALDMFGFSVVVAGCSCDFDLDTTQKGILVSMPFLGTVMMSYPWGYISDTQGRRRALLLSMSVSFIFSILSAFSPNWIALAALKLISTSFSSCAQTVTYPFLGESCAQRGRASYLLIMTSILMLTPAVYFIIGYGVLNLSFEYNLGFIVFSQWRLLAMLLSIPLGVSAVNLMFFYESPKYLINNGQIDLAVEYLRKICKRNGGDYVNYPVQRLNLSEDGNNRKKDLSLLQSLTQQTTALFKPPLLLRTLQLFFLMFLVYSSNNSFVMWYPFFVNAFFKGISDSSEGQTEGVCNIINSVQNTTTVEQLECISQLDLRTSLASVVHSVSFALINLAMSRVASRRKTLMLTVLVTASACGVGSVVVRNNLASLLLFTGFLTTGLCIGPIFSYFTDLYPTSYSGMVACLGGMVARVSALAGINLVGAVIMDHCAATFHIWSIFILTGVVVTWFLPTDQPKKL